MLPCILQREDDVTTKLIEITYVTLQFTDCWVVTTERIELKHVTLQFTDKWDGTTKLVELKHVTLHFTEGGWCNN